MDKDKWFNIFLSLTHASQLIKILEVFLFFLFFFYINRCGMSSLGVKCTLFSYVIVRYHLRGFREACCVWYELSRYFTSFRLRQAGWWSSGRAAQWQPSPETLLQWRAALEDEWPRDSSKATKNRLLLQQLLCELTIFIKQPMKPSNQRPRRAGLVRTQDKGLHITELSVTRGMVQFRYSQIIHSWRAVLLLLYVFEKTNKKKWELGTKW